MSISRAQVSFTTHSLIAVITISFRGRNGRALDKADKKQIDDDANDFNDDFTLYDLAKTEEGNVTQDDEEGRAKGVKGYKGKKKQSYGYEEEGQGFYGYSGFGN